MQDRLTDPGPFPRVVLLDTCSYCQLRCSFCIHREMKRPKGKMPWPLFTRIIDEIAATAPSTRVWMVFFGEALLLGDRLFEMIAYAKGRGLMDVVLNTNGMLLNEDARRGIIASGLDAIYVGIDAFTPWTYEKLRVGGRLARVESNTLALLDEVKGKGLRVYVQFVLTDLNTIEMAPFMRFWGNRGAWVKIRPMVSWAGRIQTEAEPHLDGRYACHWAMQTVSILYDGDVVTCACDLEGMRRWGNVGKQSLAEVWAAMRPLRQAHEQGRWGELPEFCQGCGDWRLARAEFRKPALTE